MAATKFHVDLSASASDTLSAAGLRDGSSKYPFTWSQVLAWFQTAPAAGGYDVMFALTGANYSALTAPTNAPANSPLLSLDGANDIRILFTRDDSPDQSVADSSSVLPAPVPVLGGTGGFSEFISIVDAANVAIEFTGIVFHTEFSDTAALVRIRNCRNAYARVHNNVVNIAGASIGLVDAAGCYGTSGFGVAFNTVMVRSQSNSAPIPLLHVGQGAGVGPDFAGSDVLFGGNFISNHTDTDWIVTGAFVTGASNKLYHGGNVFGGTQSYLIPYVNAGTDIALGQDRTCDYRTQGIVGISWFHNNVQTSFAPHDITGFGPVQGGACLGFAGSFMDNVGAVTSASAKSFFRGFGIADIAGTLRAGYDAGAVEKSGVARKITYHVNLSAPGSATVIGSGTGSLRNPMSLADAVRRHKRMAPLNNDVVFVLRGSNFNPALSRSGGIDLALGQAQNQTEFTGTGSVTFSGYRVFVKRPPVLAITQIQANTCVRTRFQGIKILWTEGSDLIYCDPARNTEAGVVEIARSVVRTSPSLCSGGIVSVGAGAPLFRIVGSTFDVYHTDNTASGLFVFANSRANHLFGCIVILPSTGTVVGTSDIVHGTGTFFDANYIACVRGQSGVAGNPTWSFQGVVGSHNRASTHQLTQVFVDAESSISFDAADYRLTGDVTESIDVIDIDYVPHEVAESYTYDLRECVRDASTGAGVGARTGDAGAYEFSYAIPTTSEFYVDFGRNDSGYLGSRSDRWSYLDLVAYIESLSGSVLPAPVVIHCLGTGIAESGIRLHNADAMPYAKLVIRAESPFSLPTLHLAVGDTWLEIDGGSGFVFGLDSVVVTQADSYPMIDCIGTDFADNTEALESNSELQLFNTVMHRVESNLLVIIDAEAFRLSGASNTATVSATGTSKRIGYDIVVPAGSSNEVAARTVAAAFNADTTFKGAGYKAVLVGGGVIAFSGPAALTVSGSVAGAEAINANTASNPLVRADLSRAVTVLGSGFAVVHDAGCSRDIVCVHGRRGVVAYSAFASDTTSVLGAGSVGVIGTQMLVTEYNAGSGLRSGTVFGTHDTGSANSAQTVMADPLNRSVYIQNFKSVGAALNIASTDNLSGAVLDYGVDYDSVRSLRSTPSSPVYDAGPVSVTGTEISGAQTLGSESAISGLTAEGSTWNSRKMTDGFGFRIVGYAVAGTGFSAYANSRPIPFHQRSQPAQTRITLQQNHFDAGDTLSFGFGSGINAVSVSFEYNTASGWRLGATLSDSLKNIAVALRANKTFNTYCYCFIVSASLVIVSRRFHASTNSYSVQCSFGIVGSGSLFMQGGVTQYEPEHKVWPIAAPYALFDRMEQPEQGSRGFVIRLGFDECNYPIGQFAVIAECVASGIPDEIGTRCVYAYANIPLHIKHDREVVVKRIIFQF